MKRKEDETYEDYKERRKEDNIKLKKYLNGRLFWDSNNLGTYVKGDH